MAAILFGALLHAGWNALIRGAEDTYLDMVLIVTGAGIITLIWLPWTPVPRTASRPYLAASVGIHIGYFSFVALAYRKGELGFAYPLMRGTAPVFSAIAAALLLDESPSPGGWTGIALICGGILMLSVDSWRSGSFPRRSALFALMNAAVIVLYTLVDGVGARLSGAPVSYTEWMFLLTGLSLLALCFGGLKPHTAVYLRAHWAKGLLGGACTLGAYSLALWAMTKAPIALVAALRETSVIFALLIASLFLGERMTFWRSASIVLVATGAMVMKVL
jgi:drug/metabolite transporter (DMT)-like permease